MFTVLCNLLWLTDNTWLSVLWLCLLITKKRKNLPSKKPWLSIPHDYKPSPLSSGLGRRNRNLFLSLAPAPAMTLCAPISLLCCIFIEYNSEVRLMGSHAHTQQQCHCLHVHSRAAIEYIFFIWSSASPQLMPAFLILFYRLCFWNLMKWDLLMQ